SVVESFLNLTAGYDLPGPTREAPWSVPKPLERFSRRLEKAAQQAGEGASDPRTRAWPVSLLGRLHDSRRASWNTTTYSLASGKLRRPVSLLGRLHDSRLRFFSDMEHCLRGALSPNRGLFDTWPLQVRAEAVRAHCCQAKSGTSSCAHILTRLEVLSAHLESIADKRFLMDTQAN
ncbi:unnamed protein product, partial [Symbiodinium sp. CCMP2456]